MSTKIQENIIWWKNYFWNPSTCTSECGKHLGSITGNSVITCNEIIEATKPISTKTVPMKFIPTTFYILLTFLLLAIALLIAASIYCYLMKRWSKQENLQYHSSNNYCYSELSWSAFSRVWTEYGEIRSIYSKCGKMQIRITPNMDTFYAVNRLKEIDINNIIQKWVINLKK